MTLAILQPRDPIQAVLNWIAVLSILFVVIGLPLYGAYAYLRDRRE